MSNTIRKYYQIRCITEDANIFSWDLDEPTECPNNPAHTIGSIKIIDENESPSSLVQVVVDNSGNGNYTSIAEAFADGNSNIFVKNGMYIETSDINIPDRGKLIGETPGSVIVVLMAGSSVKIDGSGGVKETAGTISVINGSKIVTGTDTTFTNLSPGQFILIGNNYYQFTSITNDTSLELLAAYRGKNRTNESYIAQAMHTGAIIENLAVTGSSTTGIYCRANRYCHIHDVVMTKNATNMHIIDSGDCSLNMFATINSLSGVGICVDHCIDLLFDYCNVCNNFSHGIEVINACNNVIFDACSSSCNGGCGYYVDLNSNHISITDGNCKQNTSHGVHMTSTATNVMVNSCSVTKNDKGILMEGDQNTVSASNICDNTTGVECNGVGTGCVNSCMIANNSANGIDIFGDNSVFQGNRIKDCGGKGIYLTGNDNIVTSTRISLCTGNGLEIHSTASNTTVTCNNVKGNTGTNYVDNGTGTNAANNLTS